MDEFLEKSVRTKALQAVFVGLWRPAGLFYLCACLAGLAAGFWPEALYPPRGAGSAPLPALRTLAVAQATFFFLAYPIILYRRAWKGEKFCAGQAAIESAVMLAAAAPFYVLASTVADAAPRDAVRTCLYVASLCPVAWAAAFWMIKTPWAAPLAMVKLLAIFLALPAGYYISAEFFGREPAWLWNLSPATFAWTAAGQRQDYWLARPVWAAVIWPVLSAASLLVNILFFSRGAGTERGTGKPISPRQ